MANKKVSSYFNGELGQRFGYRKLTIGLCSVVLGSFLLSTNNQQVKADTVNDNGSVSQNTANEPNTNKESKTASVVEETTPVKSDSLNSAVENNSSNTPTPSASQTHDSTSTQNSANNQATVSPSTNAQDNAQTGAVNQNVGTKQSGQVASNDNVPNNGVEQHNQVVNNGNVPNNGAQPIDSTVTTSSTLTINKFNKFTPKLYVLDNKVDATAGDSSPSDAKEASDADPSANVPKNGYSSSSNTDSTSFEGKIEQRFFIDNGIKTTATVDLGKDVTNEGWFDNSYGVGFKLYHSSANPTEVTVTYKLSDDSKNKSYFLDANGNKQYISSIKHVFTFSDSGNLYIFADQPSGNDAYSAGYKSLFQLNAAVDGGLGELTERAEYYNNDGNRIVIPDILDVMAFDSLSRGNHEYVAGINGSYIYPTDKGHYVTDDGKKWVTGNDSESTAALAIGGQNHGVDLSWINGGYYFQWGFVPQVPSSSEISEIKTEEYSRTVNILDQHGNKLQDPITQNLIWTWRKKGNDWVAMGDKNNGSESVSAITLPTIQGYHFLGTDQDMNTLKSTLLQAYSTAPTGRNDIINVYYSNETTQDIKFVDTEHKDSTGQIVPVQVGNTITLKGEVGQSAQPNIKVPDGYALASGAKLPDSVPFTENAQPIIINLVHAHATSGLDETTTKDSDTGKSLHDMTFVDRDYKVNVDVPDKYLNGQPKSLDWHLVFSRSYDKDMATGKITYGHWQLNGADYNSGAINSDPLTSLADSNTQLLNYTKTVTGSIGITGAIQNNQEVYTLPANDPLTLPDSGTVTIKYTPNTLRRNVKLVDTDNKNQVLSSMTVIGLTDQDHVNVVGVKVPDGYHLVNGSTIPDHVDFTQDLSKNPAVDLSDIVIQVAHTIVRLDPHNPGHDLTAKDFTRTITRKVVIQVPNGHGDPITKTQTVTFNRTGTWDESSNRPTYTDWVATSNDGKQNGNIFTFDAIPVDAIAGYTTNGTINPLQVVATENDPAVQTITFTANPQSVKYNFVDTDKNNAVVTSVVKNGVTDQTLNFTNDDFSVPTGYELVGNLPTAYKLGTNNPDQTIYVKHAKINNVNPGDQDPQTGKSIHDMTTVDREYRIFINAPDKYITGNKSLDWRLHFTRTYQKDAVTGQFHYDHWQLNGQDVSGNIKSDPMSVYGIGTSSFPNYDVAVSGDMPLSDQVSGSSMYLILDANDPMSLPASATKTITFTPKNVSRVINFVDSENDNKNVGSITVTGKADSTVNTNAQVPNGYDLVSGQSIPPTFNFTQNYVGNNWMPDLTPVTVVVKHHTEELDPNNPGHGLSQSDFEKTFTRKVTIIDPNGDIDPASKTQTAVFRRSAKWDFANNTPIYTNWTPQAGSDGQVSGDGFILDPVSVQKFAGYTASGDAPSATININSNPTQTLTIKYNADGQSLVINYVDDQGQIVTTQNVPGKTDQTVNITYNVPANWRLVNNEESTYTFTGANNQSKNVAIAHIITPLAPVQQTITRTVTVVDPDGTSHVIATQMHTFVQHNRLDHVTNKTLYGDWSDNDSYTFDKVNIPTIQGYSPATDVPSINVNHATSSQNLTVKYVPNKQNLQIVYVDDKGSQVGSQLIAGETNKHITIDYKVPEHYHMVSGNIPDYTFKSDGNTPITVKLGHNLDPRPDDAKTVTRVVTITTPDGKINTTRQTITFKRQAQFDEVLNHNVYGDWSENGKHDFDAVTIPQFSGYAVNGSAGKITVTPDTQDSAIATDITYIAGGQSGKYYFVDDDAQGAKVGDDNSIAGKTDETIKLDISAPTNYVLVGNIPTSYTFKAGNNPDLVIHLKHATKDATNDKDADVTRTITRNINTTKPDGKTTVISQDVTFNRTATRDLVTNKLSYSPWSNDGKAVLSGMPSEKIDGYTASGDAPDLAVTPDSDKITDYNITYKANPQETYWQLVDDDFAQGDPDISQQHKIDGVTDGKTTVNVVIPKNYTVVTKDVPTEYEFKAKDNQPIIIHVKHATSNPTSSDGDEDSKNIDDKRIISRTITIVPPHGKSTTETQSVTFTRTATKDLVTGKVTYGAWSNNGSQTLDKLDIPLVAGYTADGTADSITVTPDTKPIANATIHYTANNGKQTIVYVDDNGKEIGRQEVTGKTDQEISVSANIPDGWTGKVPSTVTIKPSDDPLKVNIKHVIVTIDADHPGSIDQIIPGTKNIHFPKGVSHDDLVKSATRNINIVLPSGKNQNISQAITFKRTATVDAVSGKVTYTEFKSDGKDNFDAVTVPAEFGYTANVKDIPSEKADSDYGNKTINVKYTADPVEVNVIYVDDMTGKEIGRQKVSGVHNQTVNFNAQVPEGYKTDGLPKTIKLTEGMKDLTYKLTAKKTSFEIDPNQPIHEGEIIPGTNVKAPKGLDYYDLNKDIERIIVFNLPNQTPKTIVQTVTANRKAHFDIKTLKVTYDAWTLPKNAKFASVNVPTVDGYKANVSEIPELSQIDVNNDTPIQIAVNYTKIKNDSDNNSGIFDNGGSYSDFSGIGSNTTGQNGTQFYQNALNQFNNGGLNGINNTSGIITENVANADKRGNKAGKLSKAAQKRAEKDFKNALLNSKGKRGKYSNRNGHSNRYGKGGRYAQRGSLHSRSYGTGYGLNGQYGAGTQNGAYNVMNAGVGNYINVSTNSTNNSLDSVGTNNISAVSQIAGQYHASSNLPQTGNTQNYAVLALGLAAIALGFGLVTPKKKRD